MVINNLSNVLKLFSLAYYKVIIKEKPKKSRTFLLLSIRYIKDFYFFIVFYVYYFLGKY